VEYPVIKKELL